MMVELAIGDAYGAGFEYVSDRIVRNENTLSGYRKHPRHDIGDGRYTDDTQMSLAIAETILEDDWAPESLASKFLEVFHRDPREGYAGGFYRFLRETENGADFLEHIRPKSDKSGAAMRAVPVGTYENIGEVIEKSTIQAAVTHNSPDGISAAVATSLAAHYFLYDIGPKEALPEFLVAYVEGSWDVPWKGKVGAKGWMSVRAALTAINDNSTLADILKASIAYTGDVDTVATIALGVASLSDDIEKDLPVVLYDGLEDGEFGRGYLEKLDGELLG